MKRVTRSSADKVVYDNDGKPTVVHKKGIPKIKSISTGTPAYEAKQGAAVSGISKSAMDGMKKTAKSMTRKSLNKGLNQRGS